MEERAKCGGKRELGGEARDPGIGIREAMRRLEHEIVVTTAAVKRKHDPMPTLLREISVLTMILESNRDPRAFATRLNGLARAKWIYGDK